MVLKIMNVNSEKVSTLNEKQQCAVSEIESGMQNAFIHSLEDMLAVQLHISLSVILVDKATALLDVALTEFLHENDSVFVAETKVMINGQAIQAMFIIMMDRILLQLAQNLTMRV
jgi:chemotaxis protein CheY-P-specific phosphatase CheC